jgi:crotonobetainyl-CoA:carnitine CoA-transferase CaiB-like acyl-CoA transferase
VPAAPVGERDDLFDDEQVRAMGLLEEIQDPEVGAMLMTAPAVRLSGTPGAIRFTGRHLGADTEAVLAELGRSPDEIAALIAGGAAERFSG